MCRNKMALISRLCIIKCPTGLILRVFNKGTFLQKCMESSTPKITGKVGDNPLKYTTSKAGKLEISQTLGFKDGKEDPTARTAIYVISITTCIFLTYFCILREENDIDDKLRGGSEEKIQLPELMKLKMDLIYCQKMNLPTDAIKAQINELEKDVKYKSPFRK